MLWQCLLLPILYLLPSLTHSLTTSSFISLPPFSPITHHRNHLFSSLPPLPPSLLPSLSPSLPHLSHPSSPFSLAPLLCSKDATAQRSECNAQQPQPYQVTDEEPVQLHTCIWHYEHAVVLIYMQSHACALICMQSINFDCQSHANTCVVHILMYMYVNQSKARQMVAFKTDN